MIKSVFLLHRIFATEHVEHLQSGTYKVHSRSALRKSSPLFAIHPILPGTCLATAFDDRGNIRCAVCTVPPSGVMIRKDRIVVN